MSQRANWHVVRNNNVSCWSKFICTFQKYSLPWKSGWHCQIWFFSSQPVPAHEWHIFSFKILVPENSGFLTLVNLRRLITFTKMLREVNSEEAAHYSNDTAPLTRYIDFPASAHPFHSPIKSHSIDIYVRSLSGEHTAPWWAATWWYLVTDHFDNNTGCISPNYWHSKMIFTRASVICGCKKVAANPSSRYDIMCARAI